MSAVINISAYTAPASNSERAPSENLPQLGTKDKQLIETYKKILNFPRKNNGQIKSSIIDNDKVAENEYYAMFKSWLSHFPDDDLDEYAENEIYEYTSKQLSAEHDYFYRTLSKIPLNEVNDLPRDHFAFLLIAISDLATKDNAFALGASIERFLDSEDRYIIDAAHRAVSYARLNYSPAAKSMLRAANKTQYQFLKDSLLKESEKLTGI